MNIPIVTTFKPEFDPPWIFRSAEHLAEFNQNIVGRIEVIAEYRNAEGVG